MLKACRSQSARSGWEQLCRSLLLRRRRLRLRHPCTLSLQRVSWSTGRAIAGMTSRASSFAHRAVSLQLWPKLGWCQGAVKD
ncbi:unnamed protein product [Knipowitschia caucasica]